MSASQYGARGEAAYRRNKLRRYIRVAQRRIHAAQARGDLRAVEGIKTTLALRVAARLKATLQ